MPRTRLIVAVAAFAALASGVQAAEYRLSQVTAPSVFHGLQGLRFDREDRLHGVSVVGQSLYRIDTQTGAVETVVGPPDGQGDDLVFGPDGSLYWTSIVDGIVHVKRPGRAPEVLAKMPGPNSIAFSPDGKRLFVSQVFGPDALWEMDPAGKTAPRKILTDPGGLNAFEVGEDGMIYGPLQMKGRYVSIDPDTAAVRVVADGFNHPGTSKLDRAGGAYVADSGQLFHVDLKSGAKRLVAALPVGQDNMALDSKGRLYVSLPSINSVQEVDTRTGSLRAVTPPAPLAAPAGIAAAGGSVYVADVFGLRRVDLATGKVSEIALTMNQPAHVSVSGDHLVVSTERGGEVQVLDRNTGARLGGAGGFEVRTIQDAVELPDGSLLVADKAGGRLLRAAGERRTPIASGLGGPSGLALAGGAVYVAESGAGVVSRIDLATGSRTVVADGLARPEGLALLPGGRLAVMEAGARQLLLIDTVTGRREIAARNLPVGQRFGMSIFRGLAAEGETLYFSSDVDNALYRLTPAP